MFMPSAQCMFARSLFDISLAICVTLAVHIACRCVCVCLYLYALDEAGW